MSSQTEEMRIEWKSQSVDELANRFRRAECMASPEGWASSELSEGLPHYASYLFLRSLWAELLSTRNQLAEAFLENSENQDSDQIRELLSVYLGSLAFGILNLLDDPSAHAVADDEPSWQLVETHGGKPTGTTMEGLHELFPDFHPDGEEAAFVELWC